MVENEGMRSTLIKKNEWKRCKRGMGLEMRQVKERMKEHEKRITEKMNAKYKMRIEKENQLFSVEWFGPPLKGDRLCGGYNVNSIIVRQTQHVPGDTTAGCGS
jgi:hypothetical protein